MSFMRQVSRQLDDEHRNSIDLLDRVSNALSSGDASALDKLASPLVRQLEHEIGHHFGFEEGELFPRMMQAGDGELASLLAEEHGTIRMVAADLLPLAEQLAAGTLAAGDRPALVRLTKELVERQVAHIQKETMALLPLLEDMLDDETDRELSLIYAEGA
ncbi:MAG TPA: hemerythrin domain-containing protein [Rubrivivax sp.]|nr:hemerythrin domain-containing protein [Burkholderiales bacterium]HNU10790.1 hemerythrin domain-containing protein [Rubrivivax sp.]